MFHSHIYQISLREESIHRPTSLFFKVIHTFKTYIFQVTVVIRVVEFIVYYVLGRISAILISQEALRFPPMFSPTLPKQLS